MYGTEDAAAIWGDTWAEHIEKKQYKTGVSNPTLIYGNGVRGVCHGDDFVMVGDRPGLEAFEKHMKEAEQREAETVSAIKKSRELATESAKKKCLH